VPFEIREADPAEYASIGELTVAAYEALVGPDGLHGYREALVDVAGRAACGAVLVAVNDDGALVGAVGFVAGPGTAMSEFDDADACGIRMLAVAPGHQDEGAGRALVEACLDLGRRARRRRVLLHSTLAMTVARGLYGRLGFERAQARDIVIPAEELGADAPLVLLAYELAL
jgi:predicted N-acetyltransferase YhbS